ncbi:MAG: alpha/beta hydrolase [Bacteroidetes bacterium]|nr:alpha/beta hydrolase [Bacteroidota bacterium]MBS1607184.1 alpha/beta hydrolase [Bacteroidota bacterium]
MPKSKKQSKGKRIFKWVLWVLLFQFVLINISASLHAWKQTHFYTDLELKVVKPSSKNIFIKTWKLFSGFKYPRSVIGKTPSFPFDTIQLKTKEGINIECWYSQPDSAAKGTVILFHGLGNNKSLILNEASVFRFFGYNILMVDLYAHGNSGGNTTSLGFYETEEVKLAYDYVKSKGERTIFLWGMSLGAVIIAKAFNDYEIKPSGVILDMPFYSLQSFLEARSRLLGFPGEPFGFFVTAWVGIERGYNGFGFKVPKYVKKINCPILLQAGNKDQYISFEQTNKIFDNIAEPKKRLIIYEDAGHQFLLSFDPLKWKEEVGHFLADPGSTHP